MAQRRSARRFTLALAAIVVATIVVMTFLLLWRLRVQELKGAESETVRLSQVIADQTTRSLQSVALALDIGLDRLEQAKSLGVSRRDFAIHAMLVSRIEGLPQLRSMFITDAAGKIESSALSHPSPQFSVKDRDYFLGSRDRPELDLFVSVPAKNRVDDAWTLFLSKRIPTVSGAFGGVIVASLDIAYIEQLYDSIRLEGSSPIALYLNDGTLIVRAPHVDALLRGKKLLPSLAREGKKRTRFVTVRSEGEDPGISTYCEVNGFPLVLAVSRSDYEALANWRDTARLSVVAALTNILLVIATAAYLLRRERRESALATLARDSGNQLRALVNSAMDAIVTIDSDRRVVAFNPAAQRMFGYGEEEVRGRPLDRLMPERFRAAHEENLAGFEQGSISARMKDTRMDVLGRRSDGTEFPIESTIVQMTVDGQKMYTAILRDISERRHAESELRESHRQLRELASSLQAVREEERTAIARELHDELGQQLLRLRMDLSWLGGRLKDSPPVLREKLADMKDFVADTVDTLRRVTTRLRPPLLDDLGLAEAAQWQLDDFSRRTGIAVVSSIAIDNVVLDERTSINIFRILQESLTNVARHADATRVDVSMSMTEAGLAMEIADNGQGAAFGDHPALGHGLVGIRERTLLLRGQMAIVTAPGDGFVLRLRIPLDAENRKED